MDICQLSLFTQSKEALRLQDQKKPQTNSHGGRLKMTARINWWHFKGKVAARMVSLPSIAWNSLISGGPEAENHPS